MKNYYFRIHCFLLLLLVCFTSCNAQVKTNLPKDRLRESKTIADGQLKMIKTQGKYSYLTHTASQAEAWNPYTEVWSMLQDKTRLLL